MKDITAFTSTQLLSISITTPEKLYTITELKTEYRLLCSKWHPDRNKDTKATEVFNI